MEKHGYRQDNKKRWQRSAEGADDGSRYLCQLISEQGTHVDGQGARTNLGSSDGIQEFLLRHPMMLIDDFGFYNRNHGIATTKGDYANLHKCFE